MKYAAVGVEVAAFVLQTAAAPAAFVPTQLVAGAGHDRRLRPHIGNCWLTFRCRLFAPQLGEGGLALLIVQIRQALEHSRASPSISNLVRDSMPDELWRWDAIDMARAVRAASVRASDLLGPHVTESLVGERFFGAWLAGKKVQVIR